MGANPNFENYFELDYRVATGDGRATRCTLLRIVLHFSSNTRLSSKVVDIPEPQELQQETGTTVKVDIASHQRQRQRETPPFMMSEIVSPKPAERPPTKTGESGYDSETEDDEGNNGSMEGGGDELNRLRREKRLAMNRESAKARRKRKKMLLETLEQQVADLAKRNQRYQVANEQLTGKVQQLESELLVARQTIALLTNRPQAPTQAAAMGNEAEQEAIRKLIAQQQREGAARGMYDEAALRQQSALDYQALAQASRDSAMASVLNRMPGRPSPAGIHPSTIQNTLAMPPELGLTEAGRLNDSYMRLPGLHMQDALAQQHAGGAAGGGTSSQVINELLKQRAAKFGAAAAASKP